MVTPDQIHYQALEGFTVTYGILAPNPSDVLARFSARPTEGPMRSPFDQKASEVISRILDVDRLAYVLPLEGDDQDWPGTTHVCINSRLSAKTFLDIRNAVAKEFSEGAK